MTHARIQYDPEEDRLELVVETQPWIEYVLSDSVLYAVMEQAKYAVRANIQSRYDTLCSGALRYPGCRNEVCFNPQGEML